MQFLLLSRITYDEDESDTITDLIIVNREMVICASPHPSDPKVCWMTLVEYPDAISVAIEFDKLVDLLRS